MKKYEIMENMVARENLYEIAFAEYVDESISLALIIEDKIVDTVKIAYDNMDAIMDFCAGLSELTYGCFDDIRVFENILNGNAEEYVDYELEQEDEEGHIWHETRRFEIVEVK